MIVYLTKLETIPVSCQACENYMCTLPCKTNRPDELKKQYLTKRHKDCPLYDLGNEKDCKAMLNSVYGKKG